MTKFSELLGGLCRGGDDWSVAVGEDRLQGIAVYGGLSAALCLETGRRSSAPQSAHAGDDRMGAPSRQSDSVFTDVSDLLGGRAASTGAGARKAIRTDQHDDLVDRCPVDDPGNE
jgi:hypothetical protein